MADVPQSVSRILLFGGSGQLGWELRRSLAPLGEVIVPDRSGSDFRRPDAIAEVVRRHGPDLIVNAAAYTAVDRAEGEPEIAALVNRDSPAALARIAAESGARLLHFSTDYVFDGSGDSPRDENADTGPLSVYGRTKLEGELEIRASGCRHLILRTSWVYASRGANFARTMLRLACEREHLRVVSDQIGAPTGADLLADLSAHMLRASSVRPELDGTYHAAAAGATSWHAYARYVIALARQLGAPVRVADDSIEAIPSVAYPSPAARPLNSRLDCTRVTNRYGLRLPPWQDGVSRLVTEIVSV